MDYFLQKRQNLRRELGQQPLTRRESQRDERRGHNCVMSTPRATKWVMTSRPSIGSYITKKVVHQKSCAPLRRAKHPAFSITCSSSTCLPPLEKTSCLVNFPKNDSHDGHLLFSVSVCVLALQRCHHAGPRARIDEAEPDIQTGRGQHRRRAQEPQFRALSAGLSAGQGLVRQDRTKNQKSPTRNGGHWPLFAVQPSRNQPSWKSDNFHSGTLSEGI